RFAAIVTLHEEARTAVHAIALLPDESTEDMLGVLRSLPVPYLWGGFSKMQLSDQTGLWVRSFAHGRLGLPNFAIRVSGHAAGEATFRLFAGLAGYLLETELAIEPGETIRFDEDDHWATRIPRPEEWWLESESPLIVLERVDPATEDRS
ncbi:MAG: hypothetical protein ACRCZF_09945, partial [Gemmataceae bacterium]